MSRRHEPLGDEGVCAGRIRSDLRALGRRRLPGRIRGAHGGGGVALSDDFRQRVGGTAAADLPLCAGDVRAHRQHRFGPRTCGAGDSELPAGEREAPQGARDTARANRLACRQSSSHTRPATTTSRQCTTPACAMRKWLPGSRSRHHAATLSENAAKLSPPGGDRVCQSAIHSSISTRGTASQARRLKRPS